MTAEPADDATPPLRPHQVTALDRLDTALARHRRAWVVLPPGAGKTRVGVEAARRRGGRAVAFGPNTAVQGQWAAAWNRLVPHRPAGTRRDLTAPFTALTYQALAAFDPDKEVETGGGNRSGHVRRLRTAGRDLVAALAARPCTLLLDECHHLLDVWGELLAEILDLLPDAAVVGLTATPPQTLSRDQAALVERLFGPVVAGPSIPAAVRDGELAPYAELAWFTTPTDRERAWLDAGTDRFAALVRKLTDPGFATVPFLNWLDTHIVRRSHAATGAPATAWHRFAREEPALADAALRFHHAGLLALPEGARVTERHRHPPEADDWMRLLHPYARDFLNASDHPLDRHAADTVATALPGIGYRLGTRGVRADRSPIDRVIARSAAKTDAVRDILTAEYAALGDALRAVVVCDHERAAATVPTELIGVLDEEAGSATLALRGLAGLEWARPMLVTGRTVAAPAGVARAFASRAAAAVPGLRLDPVPAGDGVVAVTGSWSSRRWMPSATRFFEEGGARVLIGTRAMLGEGWDAAGVNTLVDLTEATTATAAVQLRGRALRRDPRRPGKVSHTWSVVCVAEGHPKGGADYDRFVRKHSGYLGVTDDGEIMSGVSHVDTTLSPFAPPPVDRFPALNARMAARCADRDAVRARWRVGTPYEDRVLGGVRVTGSARVRPREPRPPAAVPCAGGATGGETRGGLLTPAAAAATGVLTAVGAPGWAAAGAAVTVGAFGVDVAAARRGSAARRTAARAVDVTAMAYATADGLRLAGLFPGGAEAVRSTADRDGARHFVPAGVSDAESGLFAAALDEVLSPPADPRYLIARHLLPEEGPVTRFLHAWPRPRRWRRPLPVVHHAVPAVLGDNRRRADAFAAAWRRWVSDAEAVYTRSAEGELLLAACRGLAPLDVETALRGIWM